MSCPRQRRYWRKLQWLLEVVGTRLNPKTPK
jgi:hypothetical protein